jgi:hypothetical protein
VRTVKDRGKLVMGAALAAVLGLASPAAAVGSTTTVTVTPVSTTVGGVVRLQATVACASDPSGGLGVTFFDGANQLDTVSVGADGQAGQFALMTTAGTHTITAAYNGNGACDASSSTATVEVRAAATPPGQDPWCPLTCGALISITEGDIYNHTNHIDNTGIHEAKSKREPRHT